MEQLAEWGLPLDPGRLIVAESASNAVLHGRVPGRSFRLTLKLAAAATLRIEVTDTRGDQLPVSPRATIDTQAESGYGLLLVEELADRWGVRRGPVPSKTVWAEVTLSVARRDGPCSGRPEPGDAGFGGVVDGGAGGQGVKNWGKGPFPPAKPAVRHSGG